MNMKNWFKDNIYNIIIVLLLIIFWIFYWRTVMYLPLFWDATIHWFYTKTILFHWWEKLTADYPPLYYYIVWDLWQFFGEKGYNLLVYISIFLILIYSYLLSYKITNNKQIWIFIMIIVWFSSKLIFYSARLYQEILITALFLISFYYLYLIIKKHNQKLFYLLVFLIWITLSVKQQWLFILYPSILFFYFILLLIKKTTLKNFIITLLIPLIIWVWAYWVLFHTKWRIIPWSEEFKIIRLTNYYWQKIFKYKWKVKNIKWNKEKEEIYNQINKKSIERKTNMKDIFLNFNKSYNQIWIYINNFRNIKNINIFWYIFYIFIIIWFILSYKKNKRIFLFLLIFTFINLILFIKNNDQLRYHLFLSFIFFIYLNSIVLNYIFNKKLKKTIYILLSIFIIINIWMINYSIWNLSYWLNKSQLYAPSIWWVLSTKEAWIFLNKKLKQNEIFFVNWWNELKYYSNRGYIWNSEVMIKWNFEEYFNKLDNNVKYIVILKSQILNNKIDNWTKVSKEFYDYVSSEYEKVFETKSKDIYIYSIR